MELTVVSKHLRQFILLTAGSFIVAVAFNLFLNPFHIASGGVSGISIIAGSKLGIRPAYTQWALNFLFIIIGFFTLGRQFGIKTLYGTFVLPLFVLMTEHWPTITHEPLLAALYGGVGIGVGIGIVFRASASTGGTDLLAQIAHKYLGIGLGVAVLFIDGLIVLTAAFAFGPEKALYALITLFITGKTIDAVQIGLGYAKMAFIISDKRDEIRDAIYNEIHRGITRISAQGGYTEQDRPILMCVLNQNQIARLKNIVKRLDPDAFVIVSNTNEVLGRGFRNT
ncbi:YitT family protein [Aneurinibacillus sp. Ricciae_BoGa-3]|uniref:YitT family protein n=1 Tax=Aneurinibacillus sp. Ricciae_BoGa-3 TaxID=3022697 RepID=UPI002341910A|nr:YitT family protein [Aneurinibacillus sp. Ricciae_BoGa-3]WCK54169.1 YitT family protein [Aneurinibacillus sp. Ricciae_BoGa-3]